jgi:hypothetical protein
LRIADVRSADVRVPGVRRAVPGVALHGHRGAPLVRAARSDRLPAHLPPGPGGGALDVAPVIESIPGIRARRVWGPLCFVAPGSRWTAWARVSVACRS